VKLSDYVASFVAKLGVKHVFMLSGGGAMHLNDSFGNTIGLDYVCTLNEQAAAVAAEAYARVSENLGVAVVTTGPGGTNAVTGVAAAWLDSTPCLFFSGQVKRVDSCIGTGLRQLGVQEIDIVSIVRSITKYAETVNDPAAIRFHLEKCIYLAKSGRPGPVWLDIPLDIQAAEIEPESLVGFELADEELIVNLDITSAVERTVGYLSQAKRPILLVGNGIRLAGAALDLLCLVEKLDIPVLTTRLGVDLLPFDHHLHVGMPGSIASRGANFALQNCDCLLVLGARLDMALIAYAPERLARGAHKIMVNIDSAEINKLGPLVDLSVPADVGVFLRALLAQGDDVLRQFARSDWLARCQAWKHCYPFVLPKHRDAPSISVYAFSEALSQVLDSGDVVLPGSSGVACEIFLSAFKAKSGQRIFHNKGTGAMGFGQPAALGACLASGRQRTVCIDGDGGFHMNAQELETVRRLNLPIKFFVIDNAGYASIRASQVNYFQRMTGADQSSQMTLPDILKVANAYGVDVVDLVDPAKLHETISSVLDSPGPVVCRVQTIPDEVREPRITSFRKADGAMDSMPLEDMWPLLPRDEFMDNMIVEPMASSL
jgi:acetolactate synthase-1/2/3 large subunit